jgi:hypothetical protein
VTYKILSIPQAWALCAGKWSIFTSPSLNITDGNRMFPLDRDLNRLQIRSVRDGEAKYPLVLLGIETRLPSKWIYLMCALSGVPCVFWCNEVRKISRKQIYLKNVVFCVITDVLSTDVLEERIAFIIRVTRISELAKTLAVTRNRNRPRSISRY